MIECAPGRVLALGLALFALSSAAWADDVLVLKDGRKIPVTRMARRDGQVLFVTAKGESFSVPEAMVVSPPLESIPSATPPAPAPAAPAEGLVLSLKDGRKIPVSRLARRDGQVLFVTTRGESFAVPEGMVVSPPLASIELVGGAPAPVVPAPVVPPPVVPGPDVAPPAPVTPAAPPVGYTGVVPPLPDLRPLGFAGGHTISTDDKGTPEFIPMPDRWRLGFPRFDRYTNKMRTPFVEGGLLDPYNQNLLKGDYPIGGNSVFLNLNVQSNSNLNPRRVSPTGAVADQTFYNQNFVVGAEIFKGDTVFQPKSFAIRATGVFNLNFLSVGSFTDLNKGNGKQALEEGFVEKRLAILSPNFDFMSVRAGMQNFNSDFRGYVFSDNQLGVRLFGNASNDRYQYNAAYFSMRQREEVTQLHSFDSRNQEVFVANLFIQDAFTPGYTAMFNVHYNHDKGLLGDQAPLSAIYLGWHGDGKWGGWNVSHAFYQVIGHDDSGLSAPRVGCAPPAQGQAQGCALPPVDHRVDINARMAALELSKDSDWLRWRVSGFYASGDSDINDDKAGGFDGITDNPNLAGGAFMFWTQQKTSLPGLTGLAGPLKDKFSLLPNLRSKFTDGSNFVNPGLILANAGLDLRVSPKLKLVLNGSYLRYADAAVLRQLLNNPDLENGIGIDLGFGFKYRPLLNENLFFVGGASTLKPNGGFKRALADDQSLFSTFLALTIAY